MDDDEVADLYERHGYALFRRCLGYLGEEAGLRGAPLDVLVSPFHFDGAPLALRRGPPALGEYRAKVEA